VGSQIVAVTTFRLAQAAEPGEQQTAIVQGVFEVGCLGKHAPVALQCLIRTAKFLQRYRRGEESLRVCRLRCDSRFQDG
jgi:hypothetical protein